MQCAVSLLQIRLSEENESIAEINTESDLLNLKGDTRRMHTDDAPVLALDLDCDSLGIESDQLALLRNLASITRCDFDHVSNSQPFLRQQRLFRIYARARFSEFATEDELSCDVV